MVLSTRDGRQRISGIDTTQPLQFGTVLGLQRKVYKKRIVCVGFPPTKNPPVCTNPPPAPGSPKMTTPVNDPRSWRCGDQWHFPVPNPRPNKHWEKCHDLVQKYDEDMFKAWKGEVDNLLIFAGLFSATVTSFTIESYTWLQERPEDQTVRLLAHISLQLNQDLRNVTVLPFPDTPFSVSSSEVRINTFWFLSLTLSMATVLVGILCMQWLREFGRDAARSHKDAIAIRQMRYEGLYRWKVPLILSLLPLLLQLALVLFFAGLLELLWAYNSTVAIFITTAVGLTLLVLVGTTILPAIQTHFTTDPFLKVGQCPYKSPQSWAFYRLTIHVAQFYTFFLTWLARFAVALRKQVPLDIEEAQDSQEPESRAGLSHFGRMVSVQLDSNWNDYDVRWRLMRDSTFLDPDTGEPSEPQDGDDIVHGLKWIDQTFSEDIDTVYFIFYCLSDLNIAQAAQMVGELDKEVAYLPQLLLPTDSRSHPSLYAGSSASDVQVREHIYMVFLWLHRHIHPSLHESYLECMIRLMNTNAQCVPHLALRQSEDDLQGVSREIVFQLLNSMKVVVGNNAISKEHGSDIWAFLRDVYSSNSRLDDSILELTFDLFSHFHTWLRPFNSGVPSPDYRLRVEMCAVGLTRVFALTDIKTLRNLRQMRSFSRLEDLVLDLDAAITPFLECSAILRGLNKRRWPDLVAKMFTQEERSRLNTHPHLDVDSSILRNDTVVPVSTAHCHDERGSACE